MNPGSLVVLIGFGMSTNGDLPGKPTLIHNLGEMSFIVSDTKLFLNEKLDTRQGPEVFVKPIIKSTALNKRLNLEP